MRLRPGFLKPSSSFGSRNASDASNASAGTRDGDGVDDSSCGGTGGGGSKNAPHSSTGSSSSHPTLLPPRSRRGKSNSHNSDARMSSYDTSQTSVASLPSWRGVLSPSTAGADLGGGNDGGGGGSSGSGKNRRRAFTAPANHGRRKGSGGSSGGGGGRDSKPPYLWGRRRRSSDATGVGGGDAASSAGSDMVVVTAVDLGDEVLGAFAGGGAGDVLGAPRTILSGSRGAGFDEAIDLDDEKLTERRRGDGDGVSDGDDDNNDDDESGGVLGRPSPGPWNDGLLADPSGAGFFPAGARTPRGDSSATPAAFCEGYRVFRPGSEPRTVSMVAAAGAGAGAGAGGGAGDGDRDGAIDGRHRHRSHGPSWAAAAPPPPGVRPRVGATAAWRGQKAAQLDGGGDIDDGGDDGGGWSGGGRSAETEDGGGWWSSPAPGPGEEGRGGWWSTSLGGARSSGDGGGAGDDRRWSGGVSSLAAHAFSSSAAAAGAAPAAAAAAAGGFLPSNAIGSSGERAFPGRPAFEGGGGGAHAAAAPPGESAGAGSPCLLLESPFFSRENGTEELRVVLGNPDLRAGFKQFLAQRWCAENLAFVEDVMRYQEAVLRQSGEGVEGSATALRLGKAIEDTFLVEDCPGEVNIGDWMRAACLNMRARDVEVGTASMNTFTPVVLELLTLMAPALRDFRGSAHFAAIEACLTLGPRGHRNSGATSGATHFDEQDEEESEGEERGRRVGWGEEEEEEEEKEEEEEARPWARRSSHVTE